MLGKVIFTQQHLQQMISERGGFSAKQIRISKEITKEATGRGRGPSHLVGLDLDQSMIDMLIKLKSSRTAALPRTKKKAVDSCSFRKRVRDIKNKHKLKHIVAEQFFEDKIKIPKLASKDFYKSRAWRELRVVILEKYECKCMMCGCSPKEHGIVVHVDHVKPRSTHPHLELKEDNLQILCEDCNLGKSNYYITDWRPNLC